MMSKFDLSLLPASPDLSFEDHLWRQGLLRVAGVDEAGRGPLAGPVSAAAVIFPPDKRIQQILEGVNDSKKMNSKEREYWAVRIKKTAICYGTGFASAQEIDETGIVPAIHLAIGRALSKIPCLIEHILVDYIKIMNCECPQTPLVKGDARSLSIAAASVLAKTARDDLMRKLDLQYPGYGFAANKGYGTSAHLEALERIGPCAIHRFSFRPIHKEGNAGPEHIEEVRK
jgi:ribonuclease HII